MNFLQQQPHQSAMMPVAQPDPPGPSHLLGPDQQRAMDAVQQGHCIFLTGGAGVGKSFAVDALVQALQARGLVVAKTASTGTAALNINGMTVHSWAGIVDFDEHPVVLAEKLWAWGKWIVSWEKADVVVLDEVSMVDPDLLEEIDYLARYMRGWRIEFHPLFKCPVHELHPLPFGGLQVVAVGDFFQLPPVRKKTTWGASPEKSATEMRAGSGGRGRGSGSGRGRGRGRRGAAQEPVPGTVRQKVPVIIAVLPPEAVDAHVAARGAAAAARSQEAADAEYEMHYGVPPLRQHWQHQQQMHQQQHQQQQQQQPVTGVRSAGGLAPCWSPAPVGAGVLGSGAAGLCQQPQSALQLLRNSPLSQPAAAGAAGQSAAFVAAGAATAAAAGAAERHAEGRAGSVAGFAPGTPDRAHIKQEPQTLEQQQQQQGVPIKQEQVLGGGPQQQQPAVKQEPDMLQQEQHQPPQPQQQEGDAEPRHPPGSSVLQQMQAAGRLQQWSPQRLNGLKASLLSQRPDVSLPLRKKARVAGLGLQLLQQQQQPAAQQPGSHGHLGDTQLHAGLMQQQHGGVQVQAPAAAADVHGASAVAAVYDDASITAAAAAEGADGAGLPAAVDGAVDGQQSAQEAAGEADDDDDICWEAASMAIERAESLSRSLQLPARLSLPQQQSPQAPPLQQSQQQQGLSQQQPSQQHEQQQQQPSQQQQQTPPSGPLPTALGSSSQGGRRHRSMRRSCLDSLRDISQPPLPFGSFAGTAEQKAGDGVQQAGALAGMLGGLTSAGGSAGADTAAPSAEQRLSMVQVVAAAAVGLPADTLTAERSSMQREGADSAGAAVLGAGAGMSAGQALNTQQVVAAAAVALPPDCHECTMQQQQERADTAAHAAAPTATAAAAAEVVDLLMDEAKPGLSLHLSSPAAAAAAAAAAAGGGGGHQADVIELLDTESPPGSPIDLTLTPAEEEDLAGAGAAAAGATAAAATAAAAATRTSAAAIEAKMAQQAFAARLTPAAAGMSAPAARAGFLLPRQAVPSAASPATRLQQLSLGGGQWHGSSSTNTTNAAAGGHAVPNSAAPRWLQLVEQAANMTTSPPASQPAEAAEVAGGQQQQQQESADPAWMRERWQRPARNVCGFLVHKGLTQSGLFDVREVKLGHVYSKNNGRLTTAWKPGSTVDSQLPQGFNWSPAGSTAAAGAAGAAAHRSSSGSSSHQGGGSGLGNVQLPVQFQKPLPESGDYCFKSPAWMAAKFLPVVLRQPYRQNDPELLMALNELRIGRLSPATQLLISELRRPLPDDGITPTNLFPTKDEAKALNVGAYAALPGPELVYPAIDRCSTDEYSRGEVQQRLDKNTNALSVAALKPGTQVLLLYNLDVLGGLANGTRGVVEEFVSIRQYLMQEGVRFPLQPQADGMSDCSGAGTDNLQQQQQQQQQQQLPRWSDLEHVQQQQQPAVNLHPEIHRCGVRGCPCAHNDWSLLLRGSVNVKLPDADTVETITLPSEGWRRERLRQAIIWLNHTNSTQLPRCRFTVNVPLQPTQPTVDDVSGGGSISGQAGPPGVAYRWLIIGPETWRHCTNTRRHFDLRLSRTQLPLLHAWAITVHKSQGMSISKLVVSLGRSFAAGMVYVALSRCTSREGLQVVGDVPPPISDGDVHAFYRYVYELEKL